MKRIKRFFQVMVTLLPITVCLLQPGVIFAQYTQVQFTYEVKPNGTNTTLSSSATMDSDKDGNLSASNCVNIGSVTDAQKCSSGSNNDLIKAGEAIKSAFDACAANKAQDLDEAAVQQATAPQAGGESCFEKYLIDTSQYDKTSVDAVITDARKSANQAPPYNYYQCVAFVQDALLLTKGLTSVPPSGWLTGSEVYNHPIAGYYQVQSGEAQPGDIFSIIENGPGHTGIVKSIKSHTTFIALDANSDMQGSIFDNAAPRSYTPDLAAAQSAVRFLRKIGSNNSSGGSGSSIDDQLKNDFNVVMDGYTDTEKQWIYNKFKSISGTTQYVSRVVSAVGGKPLYIQNPSTDGNPNGPNRGYDITNGWSYTPACEDTGDHDSPHIWLVDSWPRAASGEEQEYLEITLLHEMGHILQGCGVSSTINHMPEMAKLYQQYGGLSFYGQHVNQAGCPSNPAPGNEDYADAISYYLNQSYNQKLVCSASVEPNRPPNPYANQSAETQDYAAIVKEIVGD